MYANAELIVTKSRLRFYFKQTFVQDLWNDSTNSNSISLYFELF